MQNQNILNHMVVPDSEDRSLRILVTGASGFIGSRVVHRLSLSPLSSDNKEIICMTRNVESLKGRFNQDVKIVNADVANYQQLVKVMSRVDVAFYLIHSMEGSSKEWKKFAERDRVAAENFARAATECGIKRIVYLGGLSPGNDNELSEHLKSRKQVGEILKRSDAKLTIFRAAVILGQGGGSFQMLQYLVERLPMMVCPKWVLTKSQPISVDDVVTYLVKALDVKETEGRTFDIGGPDVLTYVDMMRHYAKMLNKSIKKIIPIQLKNFEEAIKSAKEEQMKKEKIARRERTSHSLNNRILLMSLFAMVAIGSTYYIFDARPEIFQGNWLILSGCWYLGITFSIYFVSKGARLGAMVAGIIGWITLAFWLTDNIYTILGNSIIASSPDMIMTIRNFIGAIIAAVVVAASHNVFHKIRVHGL